MGRIIGIDPGINFTGVAVLDDSGRVLAVDLISRDSKDLARNTKNQCIDLCEFIFRHCEDVELEKIVVELPRIYPHKPQRANDQMDLAFMAGALLGSAILDSPSMVPKTATPKEWKGSVPKEIHNKRVLRAAIGLEALLKPYKKSTHEHIIDAAGLALWALGKGT